LLLLGSLAVAGTSARPEAVAYGTLLLLLYVVPLFGVLTGVSAAHDAAGERPLLWAQPVPRAWLVLGKAAVLSGALLVALGLTLAPAAWGGVEPSALALLGGLGAALALISASAGLAIGTSTRSPVRGLMGGLVAWFGAFGLYDLLALALSGVGAVQNAPALWVGVLIANPVDAVRLAGLFGLEGVPFSVAGAPDWIGAVAAWLPAWVAVLTLAWTAGLLAWACRAVRRREL
jgi:hypothetical protein